MANIEKYLVDLADSRWQFPKKKAENPFARSYEPNMDETPALEQELASWYQSLIHMLSWKVEIGRLGIITDVSMMASQMAMRREGHLEAVLHVLAYLCQKYNYRMSFDTTYPVINIIDFKECKCKNFYGELK